MSNNFKDTDIYGNFTIKPLYQTYSNIRVASGNVVVPAYFQNTGNTDLNNILINGTLKILGPKHLKDAVLSQGFYTNWNDSGGYGETSFINFKGGGTGGFNFFNVSFDASNSSVLLANGNVISNNITATNKTDITGLQTKTQNFNYSGGITVLQNPNNTTCTLSVGDNSFNDAGASYGMVNLTRTANDYSRPHLAFIKAGNCVWQIGYLNASNNVGFYYGNYNTTSGLSPVITFENNGKIGIGKTTPTINLDVSGTISCSSFIADTFTLNNDLTVNQQLTCSKLKYTQEQVNVFTIPSNNFNIGNSFYRYILANYGFNIGLPNAQDVGKVITVISIKAAFFKYSQMIAHGVFM